MTRRSYPYYLANRPECPNAELAVFDKFRDEEFARTPLADADAMERAIGAAHEAREPLRRFPPYRRQAALRHCADRFAERSEELAQVLCAEAGKPIRDARMEVVRLIDTFRIAAEEATRIGGEVLPLETSERGLGYHGMWRRVPVGPCALISPFNFPLNLAAHKIAPALAAGCPFILKPASLTPLGALLIGETLAECELPAGTFSILPCNHETAAPLVRDDRLKLLSFTGSPEVGWRLKQAAGRKKVQLELGGNAACIVAEDADLDDATRRIAFGAFYQSGQSCISVQRILIQRRVYEEFRTRLTAAAEQLALGDPREESTFLGPMITVAEAERLDGWIAEAERRGAKRLCGGPRNGAMFPATLLEGVPVDADICAREAFGPVAVLAPYDDFHDALRVANASRYGLQAGVFTRDLHRVLDAWDRLEVGGVVIGDIPSWRADHMPYGGVKESGLGREGLRFAIEEMTEIRMLVLRDPRDAVP